MKPRPIRTFSVIPSLPEALMPCGEPAGQPALGLEDDAIELFIRLDSELWSGRTTIPCEQAGNDQPGAPGESRVRRGSWRTGVRRRTWMNI